MALTEHQRDVHDESVSILRHGNRLLIKGSAGVGKTFMVNTLVKNLRVPYDKKIYCSAPTNKAVAVLKGKVDEMPNLIFVTTHSALKLKRKINFKTGEETFEPHFDPRYPPLKDCGILIIDEASMLNDFMLNTIEKYADDYNVKVILIGDEKQLNPVKEEESPAFHRGYPEVELKEIIRQGAGNPIIDLSRNLGSIRRLEDNIIDGKGILHSEDRGKVIETLATVNGTDELKYLAWTNKEVDLINTLVRKRIYWPEPNKIELGETLVFNKPYKNYFTNEEMKVETLDVKTKEFTYMNNKMGVPVPDLGEEPMYGKLEIKYYDINNYDDTKDNVMVIHEDSEPAFNHLIAALKKKAKIAEIDWVDYYDFWEKFADVKYNHAITVHKSQGSTYKQAIVNVKNLFLNKNEKERNRLIYTAITRASDILILYNN